MAIIIKCALPSSKMSNALASVDVAIRYTFSIIFTWARMTWFNLIISRCQFIFIVEICKSNNKKAQMWHNPLYSTRFDIYVHYQVVLECWHLNWDYWNRLFFVVYLWYLDMMLYVSVMAARVCLLCNYHLMTEAVYRDSKRIH